VAKLLVQDSFQLRYLIVLRVFHLIPNSPRIMP